MLLPHTTFQELINFDENQTMLLLHTHWIALSHIMVFITEQEYMLRSKHPSGNGAQPKPPDQMNPGFHRWLRHLNSQVDYEHQAYNLWPRWVDEQVQRDISFFGKTR